MLTKMIEAATRAIYKAYSSDFEDEGQSLEDMRVLCEYHEIDFIGMAEAAVAAALAALWQPTEGISDNGFFLVHDGGAMRTMLRKNGYWLSTATALDEYGDPRSDIKVRETGVYEPTHYIDMETFPDPLVQVQEATK